MSDKDIKAKHQRSKSSLNNEWKKHLDDYKNYTKEYIKHYKKSLKGNLTSLCKYPYMKARAEKIYEQLFDAQKKKFLTEKQIKQISKIQTQIENQ